MSAARLGNSKQSIWHCDLMVTVTFYVTGEIIIISLISLIVIFKCAWSALVVQLGSSLMNFTGPLGLYT